MYTRQSCLKVACCHTFPRRIDTCCLVNRYDSLISKPWRLVWFANRRLHTGTAAYWSFPSACRAYYLELHHFSRPKATNRRVSRLQHFQPVLVPACWTNEHFTSPHVGKFPDPAPRKDENYLWGGGGGACTASSLEIRTTECYEPAENMECAAVPCRPHFGLARHIEWRSNR